MALQLKKSKSKITLEISCTESQAEGIRNLLQFIGDNISTNDINIICTKIEPPIAKAVALESLKNFIKN